MIIKLKCQTGGYVYGEEVDTERSKTIDEKLAGSLIAEGHAELITAPSEDEPEQPALEDEPEQPALEDEPEQPVLTPVTEMGWGELKSEAAKVHGIDVRGKKRPVLEAAVLAARSGK
jgi:hypothetical protein